MDKSENENKQPISLKLKSIYLNFVKEGKTKHLAIYFVRNDAILQMTEQQKKTE